MSETKKYKASEGHVIVEVLKPFQGMKGSHKKGDIIEVPDRQLKGRLAAKGYIKAYTKGDKKPSHR